MTDEYKLHRETERAAQAQALMDNTLLKEAFETLEAAYLEKWQHTQQADSAAREKLWIAFHVNRKVRDHLRIIIDRGKLAQRELNELAGIRGRPRAA